MPLPGLSLAAPSNATSGASGTSRSDSAAGSGGFRASPVVNIAFPGASLSASASAEGAPRVPAWLWYVGGGLGLLFGLRFLFRRKVKP